MVKTKIVNINKKLIIILYGLVFFVLITSCAAQKSVAVPSEQQSITVPSPWTSISTLFKVPKFYPTNTAEKEGIQSFFYDGLAHEGKPTRVYAYYQKPSGVPPTGGWPAVVCVHGGGGTAFHRWVKIWNDHGYAAIAMDLEGHIPIGKNPDRPAHNYSGPSRTGIYADLDKPEQERWMFHAVGAVIKANTLLRSFPAINPNKIGIHGISWGGVITSTVIGLDQRFAFAAPIYGCGFLYETAIPHWKKRFTKMSESQLAKYTSRWDPSLYKKLANIPTFYHIGTYDNNFSLDIYQKSSLLPKGEKWRHIPVTKKHGHVFNIEEVYAFADVVIGKRKTLLKVGIPSNQNGVGKVTIADGNPSKMELIYTTNIEPFPDKIWETTTAELKGNTVQAILPAGTTSFYFNITDETGLMFSSIYQEI